MADRADVLIIGGGPVGLFGLYCAGLHHLSATMIERLDRVGGQLEHLYPEKPIYDVGGFPQVSGHELVERLKQQAFQYPSEIVTGVEASHVEATSDGFQVMTAGGIYRGRTVLITGGIGEFIPRRFGSPAIDDWEGRGLYYIVRSLREFEGRRVLIVGGGDSAADWAMALSDRASEVTMIHRRENFQCHVDSLAKLESSPRVHLIPQAELENIEGDHHVRSAVLYHRDRDQRSALDVDAIIVAIGLMPGTKVFSSWGLSMQGAEIPVNTRMTTSLPGIFAAGDIVTYDGKIKLIAAGFGEAATAIESAKRYLESLR